MLYKLIDTGSFFPDTDPVARVVVPGKPIEGLVKSAAQADLDAYVVSKLEPRQGKFYLHINAMGAGEYYGSNKNGDYFPEEQLIQYHKTFEEHGYVYRHHINKDPAKSIGRVLFAIYNKNMHRVELIAEVDNDLGADILEGLASGKYPATSMATKTPYDVCSICGNKAHSLQDYCEHLKLEINKVYSDGRRVMALNLGPLRFFDISIVIRPADITSSVLRKVANEGAVPSAFLGEAEGLSLDESLRKIAGVKTASLHKLADLIKEVDDGIITKVSPMLDQILSAATGPRPEDAKRLLSYGGFNQLMNGLAEMQISPSLGFLGEALSHQYPDTHYNGIGHLVEAIIPQVTLTEIPERCIGVVPDVTDEPANQFLRVELAKLAPAASLAAGHVEKRAFEGRSLDAEREANYLRHARREAIPASLFDHLLALAGGALVAKMILHTLVLQKNQLKSGHDGLHTKQASSISMLKGLLDGSIMLELVRFRP